MNRVARHSCADYNPGHQPAMQNFALQITYTDEINRAFHEGLLQRARMDSEGCFRTEHHTSPVTVASRDRPDQITFPIGRVGRLLHTLLILA